MINGELRSQVDKLWTEFWTGGITNPLMVIEQISFLSTPVVPDQITFNLDRHNIVFLYLKVH